MSDLQKTFGLYLVLLSFLILAGAAEAALVAGYAFDGDLTDETATYDGSMYEGSPAYSVDIPPTVGASGQSLSLDGTNVVDIPIDPCAFDGTNDFSILAWFKTSNTANVNVIISASSATGIQDDHAMAVFVADTQVGAGGGATYDQFYTDSVGTATAGLYDGKWHHFAFVYSAAGPTETIYLNGDVDGGNNFTPDLNADAAGIEVLIGNCIDPTWSTPGEFGDGHYNGLLDDVKIYDEALTEVQIEGIMGELLYTTIYVDASASPPGDGASWPTAYRYLQDALADAISGDTMYVAEGTYKPDESSDPCYVPGNRGYTFQLISGLPISGGFPSGGGTLSERDPNRYETILSGDLLGNDGPGQWENNGENSYRVVTSSGADSSTVLDGFTISGGNANNSGAGMYNNAGSPTVSNCIFKGNSASGFLNFGGGMGNNNSSPTITNCVFSGNSASGSLGSGGGIGNNSGNPTVTNCQFNNNSSDSGGGGYSGGGTITNCTFTGNTTSGAGGGIVTTGNPTVTNCQFNNNSSDSGGGGYNGGGTITNCAFTQNTTTSGGGGAIGAADGIIANCSFTGNTATSGGGGAIGAADGIIANCSFTDNSAQNGGGIATDESPTIVNCTFTGNTGTSKAGGIYTTTSGTTTVANCSLYENSTPYIGGGGIHVASGSTLNAANCILWSNNSGSGTVQDDQIINDSAVLFVDYSCVQGFTGGLGGADNIGDDPCFVDADGPDDTAGTADDDLRLGTGSACIDVGDNTAIPADTADLDGDDNISEPTPIDLDGNPRMVNDVDVVGSNGTGPVMDMGAYERLTLTAYVDDNALSDPWPGDPNDGDPVENGSANHPFDAIQEAVDAIAIGGTATVLGGTYSGFGNYDIDFGGKAFTLTSTDPEDPCVVAATIIDPNGTEENPHRGFFFHNAEDANSVLTGFTITRGYGHYADYFDEDLSGGGVFCNSSSPTITNCVFSANAGLGAGIYCQLSNPTVTDCKFIGNLLGDGSGMFNSYSNPTVTNCIFADNVAGVDGAGAAMANLDSSPILTNCIFSGNSAVSDSGVMWNSNSNPIMTNCTFTGNSTELYGGVMGNWNGSSPTLTNCTFTGNSAGEFGGVICTGIYGPGGSAILTNCSFSGNSAGRLGGAIYSSVGDEGGVSMPTLTNCTFSGNTADEAGGAIYCRDSRVFIAQSVSEFSDTQGEEGDNWQYGYYDGDDPCSPYSNDDFEQLPDFNGSWYLDGYGTELWDEGGHTNGSPEHWAVRRWVSEVEGQVRITGQLAKIDDNCGDGIVGHIIADGAEEWLQLIEYDDANGVEYSIDVDVSIDSLVDFALDPNNNSDCDSTLFTANIAERPPTDYVEISNCILWDNTAPQGAQVALVDSDAQFTYCDLQGGQGAIYDSNSIIDWGDGNIDTDPNFVSDPCDGGDGWGDDPCTPYDPCIPGTDEGANDDYGDLHLLGHSLGIDTGDPCSDYSNEPQANGNRINMGAYGNTDEATVSTLDLDEDGLANPWELYFGLDPDDDDMDEDGFLDGFEACYDGDCFTYNPYDPATGLGGDMNAESDDTDEDMMTDAWEVQYSDVISPVTETDADDDPDGDRYMNFEEFIRGTVPNDPCSKPTPETFYVDDISDPCEDGTEAHPFDAIQEAMDIAISWDTVIVRTGTYTGTGNRDIDFDRRRITLTSTDPENASVVAATIIDSEGDPCDPHRGFYFNGSEDANSVLAGFTITGGYHSYGGGILCVSSSPTVTDCVLTGNSAHYYGGGLRNYDNSNPTVTYCVFTGNSAGNDGGGLCNYSSSPIVTNCTFSDNSVTERGGGMYNENSSPTLTNCTFSGNSASEFGGGINNSDSNPTLKQCIL
ncbi:MAG: right-handed parallel beta-helix repeat-containing protein, partial [Planctomycetota bacterium]